MTFTDMLVPFTRPDNDISPNTLVLQLTAVRTYELTI